MTLGDVLEIIPNIIAGAVAIMGITFAVLYAKFADWQVTSPGRAVMYLVICFDALIVMNTVHLATGLYAGRWLIRSIVFTALLFSMAHMVVTLTKVLRIGPIKVGTLIIPQQKKIGT